MNTVSLVSTTAARVVITGILSAVLFNQTVVRHTRHVLQEAERVSPSLAVFTLCISTLALLHASDEVACEVLGLAQTCTPTTADSASDGRSSVTAVEDPRSPTFSHDDPDDFKTPFSSPSISLGRSSDSIVTLATSSTVSKLGIVFRDMTLSPVANRTDDNNNDVTLREVSMMVPL